MNRVRYPEVQQRVAKPWFCCFYQQNPTSVEKSQLQSFFVWKLPATKL